MAISFSIFGHATFETLRISVPAVWLAQRGRLSVDICDSKLDSWSRRLLQQVQAELSVEGLQHLEQQEPPYVVVSNHQSLYDIPILFQALPFSLRMAAKKELFATPIWGRAMTAAGFVKIDRKARDKAYSALTEAATKMREQRISLHIAPEGTRSKDGKLGEFKRGAFEIARMMELPILPVAISGAYEIHRSGELLVNKGQKVRVQILPLIDASQAESTESLRHDVRSQIKSALER